MKTCKDCKWYLILDKNWEYRESVTSPIKTLAYKQRMCTLNPKWEEVTKDHYCRHYEEKE